MDFLVVFRALVPEFAAKTDQDVLIMLEIVKPQLSAKKLGSLYEQAASYLVAHHFAWNSLVAAGSTGASATGGKVLSEKEGDLARTYADNSKEGTLDTLERTAYGQEYRRILRLKIFPACTRRG